MEPGRELDALVAEKVMGWKRLFSDESVRKIVETSGPISAGGINFLMNLQNSWIIPGEPSPEIIEVPQYSTDIAAAWAVVEKFKSPYHFDLWRAPYRAAEISWSCSFSKSIDARDIVRADAATAAHAICLAALEAMQ